MDDICPKCGLPKSICVCTEIVKEDQQITIKKDTKRFGKVVTIITGLDKNSDLKNMAKDLKRKLACGGTLKNNEIILQGDHREKVKKFLIERGYKEGTIVVK